MGYTAATRNGYRLAVHLGTGLLAAGSIAATGAVAAVAENETAQRDWVNEQKGYQVVANPVIVRAVELPHRTKTRYVTKPGTGSRLTQPSSSRVYRPVVRVVKTTKSSGS